MRAAGSGVFVKAGLWERVPERRGEGPPIGSFILQVAVMVELG